MSKVTKQIQYNIENLEPEVAQILVSIIFNSSKNSLNSYLESLGGRPNIISEEEWEMLKEFGKELHRHR